MKIIKFTFLILIVAIYNAQAQKIHRKCGPDQYYASRFNIEDDRLNMLPYSAIVHVNIKGWGTATFINDHTLITARHVTDKKRLKKIEIYKNIFVNGKVETISATLEKEEYKITHAPDDGCHFISSDISFIAITSKGMGKLNSIYNGHISMSDYKSLNIPPTHPIYLNGYPVDQAGTGLDDSDILSTKYTTFEELLFDCACNMAGYKLFTCSGDSGAPLWTEIDKIYYLIGIHHGGPERGTIFNKEKRNTCALITSAIITSD